MIHSKLSVLALMVFSVSLGACGKDGPGGPGAKAGPDSDPACEYGGNGAITHTQLSTKDLIPAESSAALFVGKKDARTYGEMRVSTFREREDGTFVANGTKLIPLMEFPNKLFLNSEKGLVWSEGEEKEPSVVRKIEKTDPAVLQKRLGNLIPDLPTATDDYEVFQLDWSEYEKAAFPEFKRALSSNGLRASLCGSDTNTINLLVSRTRKSISIFFDYTLHFMIAK